MKIDKFISKHFSPTQRQWIWFIILWLAGFTAVTSLGYVIRKIMGIH